ncbi:MAG: hypothetical protein WD928_00320 [Gammaproteobacteria bacterium]
MTDNIYANLKQLGGECRIPVEGQRGTLRLAGDLEPLLPLFAIGQTCYVGSHAALGQDRYR